MLFIVKSSPVCETYYDAVSVMSYFYTQGGGGGGVSLNGYHNNIIRQAYCSGLVLFVMESMVVFIKIITMTPSSFLKIGWTN